MKEIGGNGELSMLEIYCIQNCKYYKSGNYRKISLYSNTYMCTILQ